jgi:ABC-type transporter Mla maintaining outer membrane lipid asymmetry permease subunit MlaE
MVDAIENNKKQKGNTKKISKSIAIDNNTGYSLKSFFIDMGALTLFAFKFFKEALRPPYEFNEFLKQSYLIGVKSLGLVGITGFIMGLVLTIQSRPTLEVFGAEWWRSQLSEKLGLLLQL